MKKNLFTTLLIATIAAALWSCNHETSSADSAQAESIMRDTAPVGSTSDEPHYDARMNGDTLLINNNSYYLSAEAAENAPSAMRTKPTTRARFTHFPRSYEEFAIVYNDLFGKSEMGTAAMIPMAMELFARNEAEGEKCFKLLCNSDATVSGIVRILKTKFTPSGQSPQNDPYIQRYLPAAMLDGATPENGYKPHRPYTVNLCPSVNKPQQSATGEVSYIYILAKGWDTEQRQVEILKPSNDEHYKVFNCPATYTQCKAPATTFEELPTD